MMRFKLLLLAFFFIAINAHAEEPKVKFELLSAAFKEGDALPGKYTCFENDLNPPLEIKNVPPKTKSLALTFVTPDAQEGTWVHWVVYNIDYTQTTIKENSVPGTTLFNDFGKFSYNGPCSSDSKEHHYVFTVYALDAKLSLNEGGILKDMEKAMRRHIIGEASLKASYRNTTM